MIPIDAVLLGLVVLVSQMFVFWVVTQKGNGGRRQR